MSSRLLNYGVLGSLPLLALVLGLTGCGSSGAQKTGSSPAAAADSGKTAATGEADGLAQLSPADRALAEKQKTCPVTGEALGSMGTPVKVTLKGQTVFLCCEGCKDELNANADKFLAKLKAAK